MNKRVFLIVLDSFGIGEEPDADEYGDVGTNTLRSVIGSPKFYTPTMEKLGLFNIDGVDFHKSYINPKGSFARLQEMSKGKDTIIGHWEIAGLVSESPLPTYPDGFPQDIISEFEKRCGHKVICNKPFSGTEVLKQYGEEHMRTGSLIVYTSADSVFQIAANEEIVSVDELYRCCKIARDMLTDSKIHAVGRVIARPFVGKTADTFKRTYNRHDYALEPFSDTMLDLISRQGLDCIGVGKIYDIFAGKGITKTFKTSGNKDGMDKTLELCNSDFNGLAFINLVDFDMLYGHRNDVDGYAQALTDFDSQLRVLLSNLKPDDMVILTADHGCDPGYIKSTDHSREYVPALFYGPTIKQGVNMGTQPGFYNIAKTVCDYLGVECNYNTQGFKDFLF